MQRMQTAETAKAPKRQSLVLALWRLGGLNALLLGLLAGCATQGRGTDAPDNHPSDPPGEVRNTTQNQQTLEQMLGSDDFDLPRALLMFSEQYYPEFSGKPRHDLDINAKLDRFDG